MSIFSLDDRPLPQSEVPLSPTNDSSTSLVQKSLRSKKELSDKSTINPGNLRANLSTLSISSTPSEAAELRTAPGLRAAEAYVRPSPITTVGEILNYGFDLRTCVFTFRLNALIASTEERPTEIFLPAFHFPKDKCEVEVSAGKWTISIDDEDGLKIQKLRWWHVEGEHSMTVTGLPRTQNTMLGKEEEDGYYDQCQQSNCEVT